ncbi:MAG: hypothetical protein ACI8QD_000601 [Cyclobacteriaceae bacterium]|jgi:hypothetical protein
MKLSILIDKIYRFFLSEKSKNKAETYIIWLSIASFGIHLLLILLNNLGILDLGIHSEALENPISAIYTPFSFILLFEVYLLVYHITKSTSNYIGKQYEIITLIVVRRLFKDISHIDLSGEWFRDAYDLQFTYDIITTILLFLLIYYFHKLNIKQPNESLASDRQPNSKITLFIQRKRMLAICLVPIILVLSVYSFGHWLLQSYQAISGTGTSSGFTDINSIFFDEFFVLLILTDVLLLLFSFFHTSKFNLFIRNSGFIISTILLRLSFSVDGYMNNILITAAVLFGVLILLINNKYEKLQE